MGIIVIIHNINLFSDSDTIFSLFVRLCWLSRIWFFFCSMKTEDEFENSKFRILSSSLEHRYRYYKNIYGLDEVVVDRGHFLTSVTLSLFRLASE